MTKRKSRKERLPPEKPPRSAKSKITIRFNATGKLARAIEELMAHYMIPAGPELMRRLICDDVRRIRLKNSGKKLR